MTYSEWAQQYIDSAVTIKGNILAIKQQLPTAPAHELKEMHFRISVLYGMYLDCMKIAGKLKKRKGIAF